MIEVIGKCEDGRLIAKIDLRLKILVEMLETMVPWQAPAQPERIKAAKTGLKRIKAGRPRKLRQGKLPAGATVKPGAMVSASGMKFKHPERRNKKCRKCGDAFFDQTMRNLQKTCLPGGRCRREEQAQKPQGPRDGTDQAPKPVIQLH